MKNQLFLFIGLIIVLSVSAYGQTQQDTVVDIDGNLYHTVKIGAKTWLIENLKVTHYRNGDSILNVKDPKVWNYSTTGAFCNYKNDTLEAKTYGKLYNWHAVNDNRSIAPFGWHVATRADWNSLLDILGGYKKTGGKLKETTYLHWKSPNKGASNSSGFLALPGGYRFYNGTFGFIGETGAWWTATDYDITEAWSIGIRNLKSDVLELQGAKANGFSVRCVKDN